MLDLLRLIATQVVFESLPVSSSGHVHLVLCLFVSKNFFHASWLSRALDTPEIMIWLHVPTLFVVAIFFIKEWLFLLLHFRRTWRIVIKLIMYMLCSNTVTTLCFLLLHIYHFTIPLWIGFGITLLLLFSLLWCRRPGNRSLNLSGALLLGLIQGIALMPGISRFAIVFVAARWMGIANRPAFFITWMLAWPIVLGMSLLSFIKFIVNPTYILSTNLWTMSVGMFSSIVALIGLYGMYQLVKRDMLWVVAIYMIIPLALSLLYC